MTRWKAAAGAQRHARALETADVDAALAGDERALVRLVDHLTPAIQGRVAGLLLRWSTAAGPKLAQEVEDLVQEVFVALLAGGGKVLKSWQPSRGRSLRSFVALVAERRAISILRRRGGRRSETATPPEELDRFAAEGEPETIAAARDLLSELLRRLETELSPLGWRLFRLLFVEQRSVEEICDRESMKADAVYAWRSRLRRAARRLRQELEARRDG